jgi:hypothetical protein
MITVLARSMIPLQLNILNKEFILGNLQVAVSICLFYENDYLLNKIFNFYNVNFQTKIQTVGLLAFTWSL